MGSRFVEVNLVKDAVTIEYSPLRLLAAPIEVAEAAIAQQEAAHMTAYYTAQVLEDISHLLLVDDGLYQKPLEEHLFRTGRYATARCNHVSAGRADWEFTLKCEECNGSGTTYTVSNKRVPCPDCRAGGVMAKAFFQTDLDGRFIAWGDDVRGAVINFGHGPEAVSLVAMPQEKALEFVKWWLS